MSHVPNEFLTQEEWDELLLYVQNGQVIPVVGPEMVTVGHEGEQMPLTRWLAPRLAQQLRLGDHEKYIALNQVASDYLLTEKSDRRKIYNGLRLLMRDTHFEPPTPLVQLAQITDFDLIVTSTFDPLVAAAMEKARPGFDRARGVLAYEATPSVPFPDPLPAALIYHILGKLDTFPDFAVWEEDYMEYLCSLVAQRGDKALEGLFRQFHTRHLLLLGAPFADWIVRFFIRAARGSRLSAARENGSSEYLADHTANVGPPTVFFFSHLAKATRIIEGDPGVFVSEMFARWQRTRDVSGSAEDFVARLPEEMPRHTVFISYASEDRTAAFRLTARLASAGVPVWLDRQRLLAGGNYERNLEHAVREECCFFVSLISAATEASRRDEPDPRYFHKERAWAAQRFIDGYAFYVPVIVDATSLGEIQQEPPCFHKIHRVRLPGGEPTEAFCERLRGFVKAIRLNEGRPRD